MGCLARDSSSGRSDIRVGLKDDFGDKKVGVFSPLISLGNYYAVVLNPPQCFHRNS